MSAQLGQLGFWTALISAGVSLVSGKKAEKEAKEAAAYQTSMDAIAAGQAVAAPSVMTPDDVATLRRIWPVIRQANYFALIDWSKVGGTISAPAKAALAPIWATVNDAANFADVNWNYHAVPIDKVASVLPVPELPQYMQPAIQPANFLTDSQGRTLIDSRTGQPIPASMQAGMFSGSDIPQEYLIAGGVGMALLLLLSARR
jgi:hypothetical protein